MQSLLKKYFGYDEFRPKQLEIINNILEKNDFQNNPAKHIFYRLNILCTSFKNQNDHNYLDNFACCLVPFHFFPDALQPVSP